MVVLLEVVFESIEDVLLRWSFNGGLFKCLVKLVI